LVFGERSFSAPPLGCANEIQKLGITIKVHPLFADHNLRSIVRAIFNFGSGKTAFVLKLELKKLLTSINK